MILRQAAMIFRQDVWQIVWQIWNIEITNIMLFLYRKQFAYKLKKYSFLCLVFFHILNWLNFHSLHLKFLYDVYTSCIV